MSDTNAHDSMTFGKTEGDGVSYRGLAWFMVVLFATTLFCQLLMVGMFKVFQHQQVADEPAISPVAIAHGGPDLVDGKVVPGEPAAGPPLLTDDPGTLAAFEAQEEDSLTTYGWVDKNAGTYRIPIERAKALLLQRGGFAVRGANTGKAAGSTVASEKKGG